MNFEPRKLVIHKCGTGCPYYVPCVEDKEGKAWCSDVKKYLPSRMATRNGVCLLEKDN